jgi:hypothetical protein
MQWLSPSPLTSAIQERRRSVRNLPQTPCAGESMKNDDEERINVRALRNVGGRLNPERSYACPSGYYGDPAMSIQFESAKGCNACIYALKRGFKKICAKDQHFGQRCELFIKKKGD